MKLFRRIKQATIVSFLLFVGVLTTGCTTTTTQSLVINKSASVEASYVAGFRLLAIRSIWRKRTG